eukprot:scaffold37_cov346-Pavlova_lutheri.AAC.19
MLLHSRCKHAHMGLAQPTFPEPPAIVSIFSMAGARNPVMVEKSSPVTLPDPSRRNKVMKFLPTWALLAISSRMASTSG